MLLELVLLALGLVLLMTGGEAVVRGATGMARAFGVSPLVIGLTVVAFGTSAPELAVNVLAAWNDRPGIAFGNIIGSNLANVGAIVGITALIRPIVVTRVVIAREIPMMLLATTLALVMGFDRVLGQREDAFDRGDGLVLLMLFGVFLFYTVGDFVRQRAAHCAEPEGWARPAAQGSRWNGVITLGGLAALVGGAHLTVEAATEVARDLGVPEVVIGLTVLAFGTSLPELVASLFATLRGHAELAIGNVVGSNIFNLLLVCGVTAVVSPITVPSGGHTDLLVMALFSYLLFGLCVTRTRQIIRGEAALLLLGYVAYLTWRTLGIQG